MKKIRIVIFFLLSLSIFSQESRTMSEGEFIVLQDSARYFFKKDRDSSLYYLNKIDKSSNRVYTTYSKGAKSYLLALSGDIEKAILSFNETFKIFESLPNSNSKIQNESYIYNYAGNIFFLKKDFSRALDCYIKAKDLAIKIKDIIQVNKVNLNIVMINSQIGNYNKAISAYIEIDEFMESNKDIYNQNEYLKDKCNLYLSIGVTYEEYFYKNKDKINLLDSSFNYYQKSLLYSQNNLNLKLKALKNIGNTYYYRNNFDLAEKNYLVCYALAKENKILNEFYSSNYNLGLMNFEKKKYNESLVFFKRTDSLYKTQNTLGALEFVDSNYRQAKVYDLLNEPEKAIFHSKIYIENFERMSKLQNNNITEVNNKITNKDINKEVVSLKKKNENAILRTKFFYGLFVLLIVLLIFLIVNKIKNKRNFERKIESIIKEYKNNEQKEVPKSDISISLNSESEKEILNNLEILIEKKYHLNPDFTQQMAAKKIKTNTTYLSSVVNKHYKKSFSNYLNDLRINFVVNEIITNSRYREYTTQAIAESAGFKNADSFTTSFKKKTGVTPFQFINEVKKEKIDYY